MKMKIGIIAVSCWLALCGSSFSTVSQSNEVLDSQNMHKAEFVELAAKFEEGNRSRPVLWGFIRLSQYAETKEDALSVLAAERHDTPWDLAVAQAQVEALIMAEEYDQALRFLSGLVEAACGERGEKCTDGERRFLAMYISNERVKAQGRTLLRDTGDFIQSVQLMMPMMTRTIQLADEIGISYEVPDGLYWKSTTPHPAIETRLQFARDMRDAGFVKDANELWKDTLAACARVRTWEDCDAIGEAMRTTSGN